MRNEETRGPMNQDQARCLPVEACGDLPRPGRRGGWYQRLLQGWVHPAVAQRHPCPLSDACWDTQHEQLRRRPVDSARDLLAQQSGPELRMAMHHHLLLS